MKTYLKKFGFLLLALTFVMNSCEDDEIINITSPEPKFELEVPGISSIFLNYSYPNNAALDITWTDEVTGSSSYTIEMALEPSFANPVALGTVSGKTFTNTVQELNDAIRAAGATNFRDVAVYVRIDAGSTISNSILFLVTTYPNSPATVTSPSTGDSFVLDVASLDLVAMTVSWSDPVLDDPTIGIDVDYTIEAAAAGTDFATVSPVANVSNVSMVEITHEDLNGVALGLGIAADNAGDVDMRIIARITNENGDVLMRTSDTFTVSVTPFNVAFPYLYFVGDATTPNWNNNNNNTPLFRSQSTPNAYHYTGYFSSGAFKILETLGQWQPQWGTNDGSTVSVNDGTGSDPGVFSVPTSGYYTYTFSPMVEGATFTVTPYDESGATVYNRIGLIGAAIGGWGDGDEIDLTQDPRDPHIWSASGVAFTNGQEFLIRPNDDWNNGVWRHTGSSELFGQANLAGSGANFPFTAPTGTYDFWFNDLDGSYVIIPN